MATKKAPANRTPSAKRQETAVPEKPSGGFFGGYASRETIESLVVAFILAFLFRSFEAEAFVIPTGSMAPTLMGAHKDISCPECGFRYSVGASSESDDVAQQRGLRNQPRREVVYGTCPLCRFTVNTDPRTKVGAAYPTHGGDRILVSKLNYEFGEPNRWDVLVFKFPGEAQTNYIKRLVGLPNETVRIRQGDIYVKPEQDDGFHIERRPPAKLRAMAQIVYDNDYQVDSLTSKGWPVRWQPWGEQAPQGGWTTTDGSRSYTIDGQAAEPQWIRYRHFIPSLGDWKLLGQAEKLPADFQPRPRLITDFYAYDTGVPRSEKHDTPKMTPEMLGYHWVGDLMVECQLEVTGKEGTAQLDLVKGGRHFRCDIDCSSGQARLSVDGLAGFEPQAKTAIRPGSSHRVAFANIDEQLTLWIDGSPIEFDATTSYESLDNDLPRSDADDPGDLAPAGIGSRGAGLRVNHLRLYRDMYYIATTTGGPLTDYRQGQIGQMSYDELINFYSSPQLWAPAGRKSPFRQRKDEKFPLAADQFFVLGDNSPFSLDARLWDDEKYVSRDLLVGKALVVFWPHAMYYLPIPATGFTIPLVPDLARMRVIR